MLVTTLPTLPDTNSIVKYQFLLDYTDITVPGKTYLQFLIGVPANYVVCGTCIQVLEQFTAPLLNSLTCSLGAFVPDSTLSHHTFYSSLVELTQYGAPQGFSLSGPPNNNLAILTYAPVVALYYNGQHNIDAYFTSHSANLNVLRSGTVQITIHMRPF